MNPPLRRTPAGSSSRTARLPALSRIVAGLWARDPSGEAGNSEHVHVFSHDTNLNICARALGLSVRLD